MIKRKKLDPGVISIYVIPKKIHRSSLDWEGGFKGPKRGPANPFQLFGDSACLTINATGLEWFYLPAPSMLPDFQATCVQPTLDLQFGVLLWLSVFERELLRGSFFTLQSPTCWVLIPSQGLGYEAR